MKLTRYENPTDGKQSNSMDRVNSTRKSVVAALGWPKTRSRSASTGATQPDTAVLVTALVDRSHLPPVPPQTCILLKFLVDFLIKNKLHKNDLFLLEAKPNERRKLLRSIEQDDIPEKLSQYSSRSVSRVVLELLGHSFTPLLQRGCVAELSRLDLKANARDCIECVARSMRHDLVPEQSALLESLLLLLYKLSLKATPQMNAVVLGELVGAKLVSSTTSESSTRGVDVPLEAQIGHFLVANTPEILLNYRQKVVQSRELTIRVQATSVTSIHDTHRAKEASLSSAAAIILGRKHPRDDREKSYHRDDSRKPLGAKVVATLSVVLTAIIDSNEDKFGLYVGQPTPISESNTSAMRLKELLAKNEVASVELTSHDPVTLSLALRSFLLENVQPLLCHPVWSSLTRNQIGDAVDRTRIASLLRETIVHELAAPAQDVILLLLATVRLALDAGTDRATLEENLAPCLLPTSEDPDTQSLARSCVAVLFSEMHSVVELLLKMSEHQPTVKSLRVCVLVAYWALKLRRKSRQRRGSEDPHDGIANRLAQAIEWLIDQTQVDPSRLRRLYLDVEDESEVTILIDKLSGRRGKVTLALFSPFSVAAAIQKVLITKLPPLADCDAVLPSMMRLQQLLESHFDLLMTHEPLKGVRDELEQRLNELFHGRAVREDEEVCTSNSNDGFNRVESVEEMSLSDADEGGMRNTDDPSTHVAATLSEWLYYQQLEPDSDETPFKLPPPGYSDSVLDTLTDRLDDVLFVMGRSRKQLTGDEDGDELSSLLDYLGVNAVLIPRKRAHETLDRIQKSNHANKILNSSVASLEALELFETLIVETMITLHHPALAALYPRLDDQLTVLLDVWGLADRAVTLKPHAASEFE